MPITLQNTPSTDNIAVAISKSTETLTNVTVPAGNDRMLLVVLAVEGNGAAGDVTGISVTYGGVEMSRAVAVNGPTWGRTEIWALDSPPVGTASVVVTLNSADAFWGFGAYVLTGVDQVRFRNVATASGNGTSASATIANAQTGDYIVAALELDSTGHAPVEGANETEQIDLTCGTGCQLASYSQAGADGGAIGPTWSTACDYSMAVVALRPAEYRPTLVDFPKHKLRSY